MTRALALTLALVVAGLTVSSTAAPRPAAPGHGLVRGMLFRQTSQGPVPASGLLVRLRSPQYGVSAPAQTAGGAARDGGGMYYFYNVDPGDFALDLIVNTKETVQIGTVHVLNQPVTDVAPVAVR